MDEHPASDRHFHSGEQEAQQRWGTSALWDDARRERLLWDHLPTWVFARLEAAPFFFLATSNARGECDCSFKGGGPGLVRILDSTHFAFPDKPGNGAFMSLGNLLENPRLGCLFIDFATGERLRVNGRARLVEGEEAHALFPDHPRAVVVTVEQVVPNCNAHIPRLIPAGEQ